MENKPDRVLVTTIARDREWSLPALFDSWKSMRTDGLEVDFLCLLNDTVDGSKSVCERYGIPVQELWINPDAYNHRGNQPNRDNIRVMREEARYAALVGGYDYWLNCDSDTVLNPDTLLRLWSHDLDIVGPVCPYDPEVGAIGSMEHNGDSWKLVRVSGEGLRSVGAIGGCLLISKRAFIATSFYWTLSWQGIELYNKQPGEDVFFTLVAQESGFTVWLDQGHTIAHTWEPGQ